MEEEVQEKRCGACVHGLCYGWHAVKIKCDIDGHEMFGYNGKDEYRVNAKNCPHFEPHEYVKKNSITGAIIKWV